jgi:hypothetical protein
MRIQAPYGVCTDLCIVCAYIFSTAHEHTCSLKSMRIYDCTWYAHTRPLQRMRTHALGSRRIARHAQDAQEPSCGIATIRSCLTSQPRCFRIRTRTYTPLRAYYVITSGWQTQFVFKILEIALLLTSLPMSHWRCGHRTKAASRHERHRPLSQSNTYTLNILSLSLSDTLSQQLLLLSALMAPATSSKQLLNISTSIYLSFFCFCTFCFQRSHLWPFSV